MTNLNKYILCHNITDSNELKEKRLTWTVHFVFFLCVLNIRKVKIWVEMVAIASVLWGGVNQVVHGTWCMVLFGIVYLIICSVSTYNVHLINTLIAQVFYLDSCKFKILFRFSECVFHQPALKSEILPIIGVTHASVLCTCTL